MSQAFDEIKEALELMVDLNIEEKSLKILDVLYMNLSTITDIYIVECNSYSNGDIVIRLFGKFVADKYTRLSR